MCVTGPELSITKTKKGYVMSKDLSELLDKRLALAKEMAGLHARYGPGGTYVTRRDILLAELSRKHRRALESNNEKVTQGYIDELAKSDPDYAAFLDEIESCRAMLFEMYAQLKDITIRVSWLKGTPSEFDGEPGSYNEVMNSDD